MGSGRGEGLLGMKGGAAKDDLRESLGIARGEGGASVREFRTGAQGKYNVAGREVNLRVGK